LNVLALIVLLGHFFLVIGHSCEFVKHFGDFIPTTEQHQADASADAETLEDETFDNKTLNRKPLDNETVDIKTSHNKPLNNETLKIEKKMEKKKLNNETVAGQSKPAKTTTAKSTVEVHS
jgi:hypothetical protein